MRNYLAAKALAECLFVFPYQEPSTIPSSFQQDDELMKAVESAYQTTRGSSGETIQTTIDASERIRLQALFKRRIFALLESCLLDDKTFAPAFLLYPRVAAYNTRAKDRTSLIAIYERFLPMVESIDRSTREYALIKQDISDLKGNSFDKVERHLADFHYGLAHLHKKSGNLKEADAEYGKAKKLCPKVYGRGEDKIKLP